MRGRRRILYFRWHPLKMLIEPRITGFSPGLLFLRPAAIRAVPRCESV